MASILIVEDESIIARDVAGRLEQMGHAVSGVVDTGEDAIQEATINHPDLILMDIVLQGTMDGIEAAERIQSALQIPVIFLTAHADPDTLQRAKSTNPFGYILKPFRDLEFGVAIEIALHRSQIELGRLDRIQVLEELVQLHARYESLVVHEFRQSLRNVQEMAEQVSAGDRSTQINAQPLERIQSALRRMRQLLTEVEAFSQTQNLSLSFHPTFLDLPTFCRELVADLYLNIDNGVEINLSIDDRFPLVCMDEGLLRHIFTSLLSNAVKYSPPNSSVSFEVALQNRVGDRPNVEPPSPTLEQRQSNVNEWQVREEPASYNARSTLQAIFRIRDQGIGIPLENQAQIFEAFSRGDNVNSIPGLGVGLAIVKRCVERHEGTLAFETSPTTGTTFTVTLPLWSEVDRN